MPGCIVTTSDGDDSVGETGNPSDDGSGDSDDAETDASTDPGTGTDAEDETGGGGSAEAPTPGVWLYDETGETSNGCEFLDDPSNGWGDFGVEAIDGGFRIFPGDDSEPFDCSSGGGSFLCPERLQDEVDAGGTALEVFVTITGILPDSESMAAPKMG